MGRSLTMGGHSSKPKKTKSLAPLIPQRKAKKSIVQILNCLYWDRLVVALLYVEEDNQSKENIENYMYIVRYRRDVDEVLFPPAFSDLEVAREGHALRVSYQHDAQAYMEGYPVWVKIRRRTLTSLREVVRKLEKTSKDVDIANLSGTLTSLSGGVVCLIGLVLSGPTLGISLVLTVTGGAIAGAGAVTSGGSLIADGVISTLKNKEIKTILEVDCQASQSFNALLDRLNGTSRRIDDWTEQHPESAFQVPLRIVTAMKSAIQVIKKTSELSVDALKVAGRAAGRVAGRAFNAAEDGVAAGVVLAVADDVALAGGRQGAAVAGKAGRAVAKAATISKVAVTLNVASLAIDVGMIAYLSYRIHNGSESSRAEDIKNMLIEVGMETKGMRRVYRLCEENNTAVW